MELTIAYYTLCVLVATFGRNCRIGFWGILLASFFLTPPLVFYLLLSLKPTASQPKNVKLQTSSWWKFRQVGS
jgi:hypothetical protein